MTVDQLIARLAQLEQDHTTLQREYARIGGELVTLQTQRPTATGPAPPDADVPMHAHNRLGDELRP